ncbi:MAG: hypothetical protein ACKPAC_20470 [Alphaproteobacteria bacterium]
MNTTMKRWLLRLLLSMLLITLIALSIGPFSLFNEGTRNSMLPLTFSEVAAQRLYHEAGLAIPKAMIEMPPGFPRFAEDYGHLPPCFIRGEPNAAVTEDKACLTGLYGTADSTIPCSFWRQEICNAVSVPIDLFENPNFLKIVESYADNMCQFLRDYNGITVPAAARHQRAPIQRSTALALQRSLTCSERYERPLMSKETRDYWRRNRPILLVRERDGTISKEIELKLQFANSQP